MFESNHSGVVRCGVAPGFNSAPCGAVQFETVPCVNLGENPSKTAPRRNQTLAFSAPKIFRNLSYIFVRSRMVRFCAG